MTIDAHPEQLFRQAPLGELVSQSYALQGAQDNTDRLWTLAFDDRRWKSMDTRAHVDFTTNHVGTHTVSASVEVAGTQLATREATVETKAARTELTSMSSRGPIGELPVLRVLSKNEQLVLKLKTLGLSDSTTDPVGHLLGSTGRIVRTIKTATDEFEATIQLPDLGASNAGAISGRIVVLPRLSAITDGEAADFKVNIEGAESETASASRPVDLEDAHDQVRSAWTAHYAFRGNALNDLKDEWGTQDPQPKTSFLDGLISAAGHLALAAATAGIGETVAGWALDHVHEGLKEFGKVLVEEGLKMAFDASTEGETSKSGEEQIEVDRTFLIRQANTLANNADKEGNRAASAARLMAKKAEASVPGTGLATVMAAIDNIHDLAGTATEIQKRATLQAYGTMRARRELNRGREVTNETPTQMDALEPAILPFLTDNRTGILQLSLRSTPGGFEIAYAVLTGFPNQVTFDKFPATRLREIKMPTTAQWLDFQSNLGFEIARNEEDAYFATHSSAFLKSLSNSGDDADAARKVFASLDDAVVKPHRE